MQMTVGLRWLASVKSAYRSMSLTLFKTAAIGH
jgi:hypothetical protein